MHVASVDGVAADSLAIDDRGLCYGDGVFETVLIHHARPVWWQAHCERMRLGAQRLGLPMPEPERWLQDLVELLARAPQFAAGAAVARMTLTRGSGGRGYVSPQPVRERRVISLSTAPATAEAAVRGLRLRCCELRLALQPRLAGIKHLNRLEQVLARREWDDPGIDEGVLLDARERVVSAIAGNLLLRLDGRWLTPDLSDCGIAGTCRAWGLQQGLWQTAALDRDTLDAAEAMAVCNSVRGILPVAALSGRVLSVQAARPLQQALAAAEPAFHHDVLESR